MAFTHDFRLTIFSNLIVLKMSITGHEIIAETINQHPTKNDC